MSQINEVKEAMGNRRIDYSKPPEVEEGIPYPDPHESKRRYYDFSVLTGNRSMFFPLTRATVHFHLRKWKQANGSKAKFKTARMTRDGVVGTRVWRA